MSRELTSEEIKELLSLKPDAITSKLLKSYFAVKMGSDNPRFSTNDTFTLIKGQYFNKENIKTTVGRYLFNLAALPDSYLNKYGYLNETLDADKLGDLESKLGNMVLNNEATTQDYIDYLNHGEFLAMGQAFYLLPSMNYEINNPIPEVIKRRDELFEKYKTEIAAGDPNIADMIEKELLDMAKTKLVSSKNPSYDFYMSKEFKFANNYKKSSILGGAFIHPSTKQIKISKSNYMDGMELSEYPMYSNLTIAGGYARGVSTQNGGYETKKLNSAMQATSLDEKGSNCGTTMTADLVLTDAVKKMFINRYIVENGKLVLLTDENIKSYVDKKIKLRSPMYCKGDRVCNICAGELFYKLNMPNAGLLTSTYSGILMNKSMKTIHDASIKFSKIDFSKYIQER